VIRKSLEDGWTYYARLLEFLWAVFYKHRTKTPSDDLAAITAHPVLFTIAAHKDLLAKPISLEEDDDALDAALAAAALHSLEAAPQPAAGNGAAATAPSTERSA